MRPLTMLIGIVMGSTVAIALGLAMVLIIFLILAGDHAELRAEFVPLLRSAGLFTLLSTAAIASFLGEVRQRAWRRLPQGALLAGLIIAVWMYWPRRT
jgi:hypothetical protein